MDSRQIAAQREAPCLASSCQTEWASVMDGHPIYHSDAAWQQQLVLAARAAVLPIQLPSALRCRQQCIERQACAAIIFSPPQRLASLSCLPAQQDQQQRVDQQVGEALVQQCPGEPARGLRQRYKMGMGRWVGGMGMVAQMHRCTYAASGSARSHLPIYQPHQLT